MGLRSTNMSSFAGLVVAAGLSVIAVPADAQRAGPGPFAGLAGTWSGSGTITLSNGSNERIRCRAAYRADDGGGLRSNLRCASDSYRVDLTSELIHRGGAISGRWMETTRNATGTISGTASEGQVQMTIEGALFRASVTLITRGDRQSVTIQAPGTDVRQVSINLRKGAG